MSQSQARRIAVAAQLLDRPTPSSTPPTMRSVASVARRLGALQVDSVNVLARAHLLPLFSRLGPYPVELLHRAAWPPRSRDRILVETWAHEASLVPVELHPLLRWERRHWSSRMAEGIQARRPGLLDEVLEVIREQGPCGAGAVEKELENLNRGRPGWWEWSESKRACEALFALGLIGVASRRSFERQYDVIERVLPPAIQSVPTPEPADAKRALIDVATRSFGISTVGDLADYWRMPVVDVRTAAAELIEAGRLTQVTVDGWRQPAFLHVEARNPRAVTGRALVCPFDPLIWERSRTERLFGFRYRIEIYTREPERVYGYYVFPLLVGDVLVGRFDLKADRAQGRFLVQASWAEPDQDPEFVAAQAAPELAKMAEWLGLAQIEVKQRGNAWAAVEQAVAQHVPWALNTG